MNDRSTRTEGKVYVYAIGVDGGPHKIGTAVDVRRRLDFLQTANHCDLSVAATVEVERHQATAVERYAQQLLIDRHRRGEWFDVSAQEATAALADAVDAIQSGKTPRVRSISRYRRSSGLRAVTLRAAMGFLGITSTGLAKELGRTAPTIQAAAKGRGLSSRLPPRLSKDVEAWLAKRGVMITEEDDEITVSLAVDPITGATMADGPYSDEELLSARSLCVSIRIDAVPEAA